MVAIYHGRYTKGFYGHEATQGTKSPDNPTKWIGVVRRFTKTVNPNVIDIRGTGSEKRQYALRGRREVDFGAEFHVQDLVFIDEVVAPTATEKTYTVEIRDSPDGSTYKYWLFKGIALNTVSLRTRVGEPLIATVTGGAMALTIHDSQQMNTDAADPATAPWKWDDGSFADGDGDAPEIIEYTLDIGHNAERRYGFASIDPRANLFNAFDVSGTITFTVEGSTYIDKILTGNAEQLIFYCKSTTEYITLTDAVWARLDQPSAANEVITETLAFGAENAVVTHS